MTKINLPLNLVDDIEEVKDPGDAHMVTSTHSKTGKEIIQLIICCPKCGVTSGSAANHIYNPETKTYHPSIIHDKKLGGCGWHGWLINGIFKEC